MKKFIKHIPLWKCHSSKKVRFNLMSRIIILIFMISIFPILLLISTIIQNTSSNLKRDITNTAIQINDITSSTLATLLEHESSVLTVLSNDTSLLNYEDSNNAKEFTTNKLKYIVDESPFISGISLKAEDQEESFSYPDNTQGKLTSKDLDGTYFYKLAKKNKKTAVSAPYFDSLSKELVITITSPILNNSNEFLGAINLDISMGTFSEYLNSALEKYKGHFPLESMIYLSNGNILASTAGEAINTKLVLLPGGYHIVNTHDEEFSASFKDIPYYFYRGQTINQLNFITYIAEDKINSLVVDMLQPLVLSITIIFMISLIIGLIYTTRFLKPLQYIVHTLTKLKANDLNIHIDTSKIKTKDLLEIALATNELTHHLSTSIHDLKKTSGSLLKDASAVDQVSTQCNHYATATLNAINEIKSGAKEQITQVTDAIASISTLHCQCENGDTIKEQLNEHSTYVISYVQQGLQTSKDLTLAINTQRDKLYELRIKVKDLGEKSSQIASILITLQAISRKINLLAFNASIEATRAGQQGNGFSVIAQEMQQLADTALSFTQNIQTIVEDNIASVSYVSNNMKQVILAEQTTENVLGEVQKQFDSIEGATTLVEQSIKAVNDILTSVSLTKDVIHVDMQTIFHIAEKIINLTHSSEDYGNIEFATLQELLSTSESLTQSSQYLEEQIGQYTV